ncbi:MAG: hypothetical protein A2474_04320 [Elusimicrobia bacterium RIFOXYC2_FULL_34_12]|nr:MAG: hypothetical protein A2474_04320 [Elusimicrobia bacterium RIFOXYC2_FULL_34_12]
MFKIAIDARSVTEIKTGVGNYILNLINGLKEVDKENKFIIYTEKTRHFLKKISVVSKVFRILFYFYDNFIFPFVLLLDRIDIYHCPAFILPLINFKYKKVITIADLGFYAYGNDFSKKWHSRHLKFMLPMSIKKADKIIAISESTRRQIIEIFKVPEGKVKTIYLGVSEKYRILEDKAKIGYLLDKYRIKQPFILFVGNLDPRKNLLRLISAFHNVKSKINNLQLVIIGNRGELFQEDILKEVNKGDIVLTGYLKEDDVVCLYNAAAVFVFPSLYEGFGLPILEAMACGCPVVTSDVFSMPEVAGDAAILINPESIDEISSAIIRIIEDDKFRENLIQKGFKRAKKFNWKKTASETLAVYDSLNSI